ncbi:hypothetical protein V1516DRAFT_672204 [Lipomyces oligophaga]
MSSQALSNIPALPSQELPASQESKPQMLLNKGLANLPRTIFQYHLKTLNKYTRQRVRDQDNSFLTCHYLKEIVKDQNTPVQRLRPQNIQKQRKTTRRGAYTKIGYSFSGKYAQVTHSKTIHKMLGLDTNTFDSDTRTIQATHVVLFANNVRPPSKCYQLYQASHLCGKPNCIRLEHLLWELKDSNESRRMCHTYGAYEHCPHTPCCILRANHNPSFDLSD